MKDLTKTMDITMKEMEEEEEAAEAAAKQETIDPKSKTTAAAPDGKASLHDPPPPHATTKNTDEAGPAMEKGATAEPFISPPTKSAGQSDSGSSTPRRGLPTRHAIMDRSEDDAALNGAGLTEEEKELRKKEKKKGLSKEQVEELAAYEKERKRIRDERVETLAQKLIQRVSIWTETDKGSDVTKAFQAKTKLEVENLKMESFGIEILHAIGSTYLQKATSFLKSQKFLGISGFFSRLKDKGTLAKETWTTISTAIDAQLTMEEMAKMEEKGGEEWTDERRAEYEKRVTGKVLAAAWRGSKFEIQSVLRDVCDTVLNDRAIPMGKRIERAHALVLVGEIYHEVCLLACCLQRRRC